MYTPIGRQRGVSTLIVAIVLLIAATFLTFFAAKVGVQEQRMSGNDRRQKVAFATAEGLLDRATTYLTANTGDFITWAWSACSGTALPCGDGTSAVFNSSWSYVRVRGLPGGDTAMGSLTGESYFLTKNTSAPSDPVVLVARGRSDDQSGDATIRQVIKKTRIINVSGNVPPLMSPTVGILGSFVLVTNPDPGRQLKDVPKSMCDDPMIAGATQRTSSTSNRLSIWAKNVFNGDPGVGSWNICEHQDFLSSSDSVDSATGRTGCFLGTVTSGCGCAADPDPSMTRAGDSHSFVYPDDRAKVGIADNDPSFPTDVFGWLFGGASPATIKGLAGSVLADCSSLTSASKGLIWVTGDCSPPGDVGSRFSPVLLVIEGKISFTGGTQVWGLVVAHNSPSVKLAGGFTLHGSMIVDSTSTALAGGGTYNAIYDPCVFASLLNNNEFFRYAPMPGGWSDRL